MLAISECSIQQRQGRRPQRRRGDRAPRHECAHWDSPALPAGVEVQLLRKIIHSHYEIKLVMYISLNVKIPFCICTGEVWLIYTRFNQECLFYRMLIIVRQLETIHKSMMRT